MSMNVYFYKDCTRKKRLTEKPEAMTGKIGGGDAKWVGVFAEACLQPGANIVSASICNLSIRSSCKEGETIFRTHSFGFCEELKLGHGCFD